MKKLFPFKNVYPASKQCFQWGSPSVKSQVEEGCFLLCHLSGLGLKLSCDSRWKICGTTISHCLPLFSIILAFLVESQFGFLFYDIEIF